MGIELRDITKSFGKNAVIKNFSLTIEKGERSALVSYSGSGKTTLFRIIAGLDKRFEGERKVDGIVAFMFQEDRLFEHSTVLENVTAVSDRNKEIASEILIKLGLSDYLHSYPDSLSGGQRRRVALARALFYDGDVVLLDECFTGLDSETREATAKVINEFTAGKTLLLITHDREEAKLLDCKLLVYDKGFVF